jgi:hypothetical protein
MKLNAAARKTMPKSEFAGPGKSFPVNDRTHAKLAIPMATRSERAGNISAGTADKIKATARAKLGESEGKTERRGGVRHPASHAEFEALGN